MKTKKTNTNKNRNKKIKNNININDNIKIKINKTRSSDVENRSDCFYAKMIRRPTRMPTIAEKAGSLL